jgi:hypothetical protein
VFILRNVCYIVIQGDFVTFSLFLLWESANIGVIFINVGLGLLDLVGYNLQCYM